MMNQYWKVLKTEADYKTALNRLDEIAEAEVNSAEGNELELLVVLIKNYEDRFYPFKLPEPLDMIKLRMEEMGLKNKDLVDIIGSESHVSSVLSGKRQITLEMARKLSKKLNIRASIFINDNKSFDDYENEGNFSYQFDSTNYLRNRRLSLNTQCSYTSKQNNLETLLDCIGNIEIKDDFNLIRDKSPLFISYAHHSSNEHIYILIDAVMHGMNKKKIEADELSDLFIRLGTEKVK
jgi:HTH-type transcriptional regulator/antitoxin HigA